MLLELCCARKDERVILASLAKVMLLYAELPLFGLLTYIEVRAFWFASTLRVERGLVVPIPTAPANVEVAVVDVAVRYASVGEEVLVMPPVPFPTNKPFCAKVVSPVPPCATPRTLLTCEERSSVPAIPENGKQLPLSA